MADREKVIAGLKCCSCSKLMDKCNECPYFSSCGTEGGSFVEIAHDAIALLKAQEPRVMMLEEVDALGDNAIVWLECLYFIDGKITTTLKPAIYQPDNSSPEEDGYYCVVSSWGKSGFYHKDNYMGDWRCWNVRPSQAEMEAMPWNGSK